MLTFVKYTTATTALTRKIVADASSLNLKGDFLTGIPTLFEGRCWLLSILQEKYNKQHNDLKVKEDKDSVYIVIKGAMTGKETKLCGFENVITDEKE